jgi:hypothetical protein
MVFAGHRLCLAIVIHALPKLLACSAACVRAGAGARSSAAVGGRPPYDADLIEQGAGFSEILFRERVGRAGEQVLKQFAAPGRFESGECASEV